MVQNKAAKSLASRSSDSTDSTIIPVDGIYSTLMICKLMNISPQALCYYTRRTDYRRLRYFKRLGSRCYYYPAVEVFRFLIVNNLLIPPSVHQAIQNFNRNYGGDAWQDFKNNHKSVTADIQGSSCIPYQPPCPPDLTIPSPLPKLSSVNSPSLPTPPPGAGNLDKLQP